MSKRIVGRFLKFPAELCRAQNGSVNLRTPREERSFDVTINSNGKFNGAAAKGSSWPGPNGMSMKTIENSKTLVARFLGQSVKVYNIPKNTPVPDGLVLVLEDEVHYSLQPLGEMDKAELDSTLQRFLDGLHYETKEAWLQRVVGGASSSSAGVPSSSNARKASSSKSRK